jgi:hypothetical protein
VRDDSGAGVHWRLLRPSPGPSLAQRRHCEPDEECHYGQEVADRRQRVACCGPGAAVSTFKQNARVPFTGDDAKPALLDEVAEIEKKQALWVLIGALTGFGAGLVVAPLAAVIGGPAALCVYVLQREKIDVNRVLNDPPRRDHEVRVRARQRRFEPPSPQTPVEGATAEFVRHVLERSAYVEAAVRADERAQRALKVGDHFHARRRLYEGQRAADRAAAAARSVARASDELAFAWSTSPEVDLALGDPAQRAAITRGMRGNIEARAVFPPEALDYVARTKLVTEGLKPIVRIRANDADAVAADPRGTIRTRTATYASVTVRATRRFRESYGAKTSDWSPED